ncbi:Yip1 family protein [Haladaptatus sp. DJG-WS-42]|uniref:Yip1 family protein n=1 Tax=Haladaptatus sp. DJG-WS-42 TaxID=3120516 RepID=UPI0030D0E38D
MLQTLLFDPDAFFADNPWADDFVAAAGAVAAVAVVTVLNLLLIGVILTQKIDGTVTQNGRQVSMDSIFWDVLFGQLFTVFFAVFLGWVLLTVLLHIGIKLANGEGTFRDSLRITGWAMVPTIFTAFLGTLSVYLTLRGQPVTSSTSQLTALVARMEGGTGVLGIFVALIGTVWQGYIWTFGIKHFHSLKLDTAMGVAGIVALIFFLFSVI